MTILAAYAVPHPPLILPAVGRGEEAEISDTIDSYYEIARRTIAHNPDVIVVTSPHAPLFRDAFHITTSETLYGDMSQFRARQEHMEPKCDTDLARAIEQRAQEAGITCVDSSVYPENMDHATYIPLYFLREVYHEEKVDAQNDLPCPIVRIGLSGMSSETHRKLGQIIARLSDELGRKVVFIASGDLSHKLLRSGPYGFAPQGPEFDRRITECFDTGNLEEIFEFDPEFCEAAAECGWRSFEIMAGALEGCDYRSELLSYEGPFGVGYGVAAFEVQARADRDADQSLEEDDLHDSDIDPYIALARLSVETYVRTGHAAHLPHNLPDEMMNTRAGAFVSLHEEGELRGCIGTIAPTKSNVAKEVLRNAIAACSEDPRFAPVKELELDWLSYSVDVLTKPEHIQSEDELDPKRYGVIVTKGMRRGLLLPDLEGVDTVKMQVSIAKRKAGINPQDKAVKLERFEVIRHTKGGEARRG
ncbi:MAG: AmmeMemoRadiSam system protein A [Eggerthellaceae bacterium]|jgi:AmmeMemoRadiSam system protein A